MKAFKDKGRYSELMARIPVKVIMNDKSALLGAALRAAELLQNRDRSSSVMKPDSC